MDDALDSPPAATAQLLPGMILVAAGSPASIKRLSEIARPITQAGSIVVAGFGDVGRKLVEMLKDAGEEVCVIDELEQPGVDVIGDVLDTGVLDRAGAATSRVVILACENDSATLLAATVVRAHVPDVPIIACAELADNVGRIQQAGANFALSVSQVAGQLLAHHILGEMVSQQARIKLVRHAATRLAGQHPLESGLRERTGCTIVAVERAGSVITDISWPFVLASGDTVYVCGTAKALNRFYEEFAEVRT